jgi:hypothetical protein
MAQFKNVSGEDKTVKVFDYRAVKNGDVIDVPDDLVWSEDNPTGLVWPDATWEPVTAPAAPAAPVEE